MFEPACQAIIIPRCIQMIGSGNVSCRLCNPCVRYAAAGGTAADTTDIVAIAVYIIMNCSMTVVES
jgi:hypothetical protein